MAAERPGRAVWLAAALLIGFFVLALHAARRLSPTWDEVTFAPSGVTQWKTGSMRLNWVNPLSKLIAAAPLLPLRPDVPWTHPSWSERDDYRFGFQFFFRNRVPAPRLVFWSRVPMAILFALTGALLFFWIRSLWGTMGALAALGAFVTTPAFLSRASVAHAEMPAFFFMTLALFAHARWAERGSARWWSASAAAAGLACLAKLTALPLLAAIAVLDVFDARRPPGRRVAFAVAYPLAAAGLFAAFHLPWPDGVAALGGGIRNLLAFDEAVPFYWNGRYLEDAPALLSFAAFAVKAPPHLLLLAAAGAAAWWTGGKNRSALLHFAALAGASLGAVFFFDRAVSTIQLAGAYIGFAGLAGGLAAARGPNAGRARAAGAILLALGAADVLRAHPNYLAYFSPLAGGERSGARWLADSDQDWGQWLPALKSEWDDAGRPPLLLCYSGSADPEAYGLAYQDLLSPALVTRQRRDRLVLPANGPVWIAVGTKVLQTNPEAFGPLRAAPPAKRLSSGTALVYDGGGRPEVFRWLAAIYEATGRPAHARAAEAQAQRAEK